MERLEEIKKRRQSQFIMNRLKVGSENRDEADFKEIKDFMHLIKAPHGLYLFLPVYSHRLILLI